MTKNNAATENANIELVKPSPLVIPDYLVNETPIGLDELGKYVIPPRVKIIQKQAAPELLALFQPGDVIVSPQNSIIAEPTRNTKGQIEQPGAFRITPIFFFAEWCAWNDYKLKGIEPAIFERSFDPTSDIAAKCRDPKRRIQPHPTKPEYNLTYSECLNFIIVVHDCPEVGNQPCVLTYARGAHNIGATFASRIKARKTPIFAGIYNLVTEPRKNQQGEWFVLNSENPSDGPAFVDKETFLSFKTLHEEFVALFKANRIQVAYDETEVAPESQTPTEF